MTTAVEQAIRYAEKGWPVFPLRPKSKRPPTGFEWRKKSTTDVAKIKHWAEKLPGCNFGLDCGKAGIAVIDVDVKHEGAEAALTDVALEHGLPDTMVVHTPSGGRHLYYLGNVKNSVQKLGTGIDTRGEGGYVVIPGSVIDEDGLQGSYTVEGGEPKEIPQSIVEVVGAPKAREESDTSIPVGDMDLAHNIASFVSHMQNHGPVMQGERNKATYLMAASAWDCGLSREMAVELMKSTWLPLLEGDFTVTELIRTVDSAYKTARNQPGCDTPEAMFPDDLPEDSPVVETPKEELLWPASGIKQDAIPARDWIVGTRAIAGFVDVLIAPGGMSKSTFLILECMAIVTGKPITGDDVTKRGPCWLLNGEDPKDEMQRRVAAAAKHYNIPLSELDEFYLSSGYGKDFALIADTGKGIAVNNAMVDKIISTAKRLGIVRIVLDPLVRFHRADENDNMALDRLMQVAARIAKETGAAVSLAHHTRKRRNNDEGNGDADTARGASSVVSAARIAHTMGGLGQKEAKKLGLPESMRRWYVRVDDAKSNLAPPAQEARWFKRVSVELENGDKVGVLELADLSFVKELSPEDQALADAVYDIMVSRELEESTAYALAKEIVEHPEQFPEVEAVGGERTIRARISAIFAEPVEVCGRSIVCTQGKGKTGKVTDVVEWSR